MATITITITITNPITDDDVTLTLSPVIVGSVLTIIIIGLAIAIRIFVVTFVQNLRRNRQHGNKATAAGVVTQPGDVFKVRDHKELKFPLDYQSFFISFCRVGTWRNRVGSTRTLRRSHLRIWWRMNVIQMSYPRNMVSSLEDSKGADFK